MIGVYIVCASIFWATVVLDWSLRRDLEWLTKRLAAPRVIFNRMGTAPYLSRWYLKGRPTMPDGSSPFDVTGGTKIGAVYPEGTGIYLHRFHESDDAEFHNHPFIWSFAIILVGGYSEERLNNGKVTKRRVRPWSINVIRNKDYHRVDLVGADAWSLFVAGPKSQEWGFINHRTMKFMHWRDYIQAKREGSL